MNAWFIAAGVMLAGAFGVHVVAGTRFYAKARPERELPGRAPEDAVVAERRAAWMLGRCGFQLISVDLALSAGCFLALGLGLIPRNAVLELFLTLTYAGWGVAWRAVLAADRLPGGLPASPAPLGRVLRRRPDGRLRNGSLKRDVSSDRLRSPGRSEIRHAPGAAAAADKTMADTPTGKCPPSSLFDEWATPCTPSP